VCDWKEGEGWDLQHCGRHWMSESRDLTLRWGVVLHRRALHFRLSRQGANLRRGTIVEAWLNMACIEEKRKEKKRHLLMRGGTA
jgi:hypothetical protein